jgi:hypothetical protein
VRVGGGRQPLSPTAAQSKQAGNCQLHNLIHEICSVVANRSFLLSTQAVPGPNHLHHTFPHSFQQLVVSFARPSLQQPLPIPQGRLHIDLGRLWFHYHNLHIVVAQDATPESKWRALVLASLPPQAESLPLSSHQAQALSLLPACIPSKAK